MNTSNGSNNTEMLTSFSNEKAERIFLSATDIQTDV